jgi:uncharacterized phiE125 gp8 family phage protein
MRRAIVAPAILAGAALDELKAWLAITTASEDTLLTGLLRGAHELCEAFTGTMPLEALCEEVLPVCGVWQGLQARPVAAITGVEGIAPDGTRSALGSSDYLVDLDADGGGRVKVLRAGTAARVAVRFTAGLAADWSGLPDGLRQGVLRLAAAQYRERDTDGPPPVPPAAVAALWRPWRRMRLA